MRRARVAVLVAVSVLAAARVATAARAAAGDHRSGTGDLRIPEKTEPGRGIYVEGSIQFVGLRRAADLRLVATRRFRDGRALRLRLRPGRYGLASRTRVCAGNCGLLGPPEYRCATAIRIRRGGHVTVTLHDRVGVRCRSLRP
jgi:hypothetical protein